MCYKFSDEVKVATYELREAVRKVERAIMGDTPDEDDDYYGIVNHATYLACLLEISKNVEVMLSTTRATKEIIDEVAKKKNLTIKELRDIAVSKACDLMIEEIMRMKS